MRDTRATMTVRTCSPRAAARARSARAAAIVAAAFCVAGCSLLPPAAPETDGAFGQSVRRTLGNQVLDPAAGRDSDLGVYDSQAARHALVRHRDSFKEPPPTFTVFGLGGNRQQGQ